MDPDAALPPEGAQFAPWERPCSANVDPHACGFAAALPPEGAQFAPWERPCSANDQGAVEQGNGVADGIRTHDNRNHNPGLYQLSYSHR